MSSIVFYCLIFCMLTGGLSLPDCVPEIVPQIAPKIVQDMAPQLATDIMPDIVPNNAQDLAEETLGLTAKLTFQIVDNYCKHLLEQLEKKPYEPLLTQLWLSLRKQRQDGWLKVPLAKAGLLWNTPEFDKSKPLTIFITGWTTNKNNTNGEPVEKAYRCRNDNNFLLLDTAYLLNTMYSWAAFNTEDIGKFLAEGLAQLDQNYVCKHVHIIGHSLGAQIASSAGRHYQQLPDRGKIPRITGLDPARPCFYAKKLLPGLRSGDAKFVDIVHTNPGVLGEDERQGDADFFVDGLDIYKTGCTGSIICSHERAIAYWAESVYPNNMQNFKTLYCKTYEDLQDVSLCMPSQAVMGLAASSTALGIYYVNVNAKEPYGKQAKQGSFSSSKSQCGDDKQQRHDILKF